MISNTSTVTVGYCCRTPSNIWFNNGCLMPNGVEQLMNPINDTQETSLCIFNDSALAIYLNHKRIGNCILEVHSAHFSCEIQLFYLRPSSSKNTSVRPSVRPSLCLVSVRPPVIFTMSLSSYHRENFRIYYQWQKWCPCKGSRSEVKGHGHRGQTQLSRFRTVTPVWNHIWWWNDAQSLMLLRREALLFFKVIRQLSKSHG